MSLILIFILQCQPPTEKIEAQFEAEAKPALTLSSIPTVLRPDANDAYSCKVHCLLEQSFVCAFAVFSSEEMKCYIGLALNGSPNQFISSDMAYTRKGRFLSISLCVRLV